MRNKFCFYYNCLIVATALILSAGCKKSVEAKISETELTGELVFENDATATAAMLGIYSKLNSGSSFGNGNITMYCGLAADEFTNFSVLTGQQEFYNNDILPTNKEILSTWSQLYSALYQANAVIEGVQKSNKISPTVKNQLTGEAKFMRAFCYYYLVQLFGQVPLIVSTDYQQNAVKSESTKDEIYEFAVTNLEDAATLLPDNFSISQNERTRPNKFAAEALLARIFLFLQHWSSAEQLANDIITSGNFKLTENLDDVFLKNSEEAIWQLWPVEPNINTREGNLFIISGNPTSIALSEDFVNSFEPGDHRRSEWIGQTTGALGDYFYPFKYKVNSWLGISEYYSVFRLAEQYLIRAEARAALGKITGSEGAVEDINIIRERAGLLPVDVTEDTDIRGLIIKERKSELFAEWGHRWLDLKRTEMANSVLSHKGTSWSVTDTLFPKPASEILLNNRIEQNDGYQD